MGNALSARKVFPFVKGPLNVPFPFASPYNVLLNSGYLGNYGFKIYRPVGYKKHKIHGKDEE